jgi:hypothetical protein
MLTYESAGNYEKSLNCAIDSFEPKKICKLSKILGYKKEERNKIL